MYQNTNGMYGLSVVVGKEQRTLGAVAQALSGMGALLACLQGDAAHGRLLSIGGEIDAHMARGLCGVRRKTKHGLLLDNTGRRGIERFDGPGLQ